jgi:hypothetical protein
MITKKKVYWSSRKVTVTLSDFNKTLILTVFMFVPCISSIKAPLLFHSNAHNHKITGILKTIKNSDRHSDMFRFTQEPSSGSHFCAYLKLVMILYPHRSWCGQCHGSMRVCGVPHTRTTGWYDCVHHCGTIKVLWILTDFQKNTQILNVIKIHPVGAKLFHTDEWTDRGMDRRDEANSYFSQFCELV